MARGRLSAGARTSSRVLAAITASALAVTSVVAGLVVLGAPAATADTAPPLPTTPPTVSADALPTVQINGVVWSQVTVGNTVYATGEFTSARPAGSPAGTNETPRKNLLAYDITTGNLITSFNHSMNAQGMVVSASPDGSRVYVGGDFTSVDGVFHNHLVAFSTATGALINAFAPNIDARVRALAPTNTTVYAGGSFTAANGSARARLAAFSAGNGALLGWAPTADDREVQAMVLTPDQSKVIVGGKFTTLSTVDAYGMGAVSAASGAVLPWAANQTVRNAGDAAGVNSLRTDGKQIFGTGFVFGPGGNAEGTFAMDPAGGAVNWVEDCHGDTYDTFTTGQVLYKVSHSHYCGNIGSFPETNPRSWHWATAYTTYPTGTVAHDTQGYYDWYGTPAPTQLAWYPDLESGTYTHQGQAAWSMTGNASYVALGGEFPKVNGGSGQQGLVRFAVRSIAPNKMAPRSSAGLTPNVVSLDAGTARLAWKATSDQDNEALTYKVVRDGKTTAPVFTTTVNSRFYRLPSIGFTDTGLVPGRTYSYRIYVTDPLGNTNSGSSATVTVTAAASSQYAKDVRAAGATNYWRLGESAGTTGYDWAGFDDLAERTGVGHGAAGAIGGDANAASTFDGSDAGTAATTSPVDAPSTYSLEAWVNTTSTSGGKIIGFGNAATGNSTGYDRHLYMDNSGRILFGVYVGGVRTIAGSGLYNDGQWHHVVGTQSAAGMLLYVDGKRVARDAGVTGNEPALGYWRVGGDNLNAWPAQPASNDLAGSLDDIAVYPTALTVDQVQQHYTDSGRTVVLPPVPTDNYGKAVYGDNPDLYWRVDEAAGPTAVDTTTNGTSGTYSGGVSYRTPTPVTGTGGTGVQVNGSDGLIVSQTQVNNPTVYTEELWFSTTTRSGGKLIGFGNAPSGNSGGYDRHVWMLNTGQLVFGTYTGQLNTATSPSSYNDGTWHHMVASQGADGMHLYVDGVQVATNGQTSAQDYAGYWRVGGDNVWYGADSNYFAGAVDEVAVYSTELSAGAVTAHYRASPAAANKAPVASATASCAGLTCSFSGAGSSDPDGRVVSWAWDFGDSTTGAGATPSHTYTTSGSYVATLVVTDDEGATSTTSRTVTVTALPADSYGRAVRSDDPDLFWRLDDASGPTAADASPHQATGTYSGGIDFRTPSPVTGSSGTGIRTNGSDGIASSSAPVSNPTVYSEELWFSTTTTSGGKLIGFGSAPSGSSGSYDRHVWMLDSGQLVFGTYTGQTNTATSPGSYNDGTWHHLVATQGPAGMRLYVDGGEVASNGQTAAEGYNGYWRIGGDNTWGGASSNYFAGALDEVAVYSTQLSASRVAAHFAAAAKADQPPSAAFTSTCTGLSCSFDGSTSSDPEGPLASYAWTFGDGATSTTATTTHGYTTGGTYPVTLSVTDQAGTTRAVTHDVVVTAPPVNQPPVARFTSQCTDLSCQFDGSTSSDPEGAIASYAWSFGDGGSATTASPAHPYASAGTYAVRLVVTDASGATGTVTRDVVVTAPPNQAPTAPFTSVCTALSCSFDGSGSSDADGTVASYAWAFGDGATSTLRNPTHTYPAAGDYPVRLTVTDDRAATGERSATVVTRPAANPTPTPFVADAFGRTTTNGLGTADKGGAWATIGTASNLSVSNGTASFLTPTAASQISAYLGTTKVTDADTTVTLTTDKAGTGSGLSAYVVGRRISLNNEYRARVRLSGTSVYVSLSKLAGSSTETLVQSESVLPGVSYTPGTALRVRLQVTGTAPTTLRLKVWPAAGAEPSTWQLSGTDASASLQAAGGVGITSYLTGSSTNAPVVLKVSNLSVVATAAAPTASFTTACTARSCSVDGSSSSDPSGAAPSYEWSWGDGAVTAGVTSSHTYTEAGTYRQTLTVTNAAGWKDVTTRTVTVT